MSDLRNKVEDFYESIPDPTLNMKELSEALYTVSENGLWADYVDNVSVEQAIKCWKIVEKIKNEGFPEELWM